MEPYRKECQRFVDRDALDSSLEMGCPLASRSAKIPGFVTRNKYKVKDSVLDRRKSTTQDTLV